MPAPDAAALDRSLAGAPAEACLRGALDAFRGRIAVVSSFGADSAVLLHMLSRVDPSVPVLLVDTGILFPETLAYRDALVGRLGLTNLRSIAPDARDLAAEDPDDFLWSSAPDQCCDLRKVRPLARALDGFDAWVSGRKRFQAVTRAALPAVEADGRRVKVNPLVDWSAADIAAYLDRHGLPAHPLVARRYLSIGCIPCTSPVRPGEDARSGRWRGQGKRECGIHRAPSPAGTPWAPTPEAPSIGNH